MIVVGAFCDRASFASLAAVLASDFTVHTYDRRGRGDSGDAAAGVVEKAVEREVEDLAAVIAAAGGSAVVVGHSSGAALALQGAARGLPITRLVAYEPPYSADPADADPTFAPRIAELLAADRPGDAAALFLGGGSELPPEVLAQMQSGPGWPHMLQLAPTLLFDLAVVGDEGVPERLGAIAVPTRWCSRVARGGPGSRPPQPWWPRGSRARAIGYCPGRPTRSTTRPSPPRCAPSRGAEAAHDRQVWGRGRTWQSRNVPDVRWAGVPPRIRAVVLAAAAVFAYGTVVHVVDIVTRGIDAYPAAPVWLATYFLSLTVFDAAAAILLLLRRRSGLLLGCAVLVTGALANALATYLLGIGGTPERVGQAVITVLAVALLVVAPRIWPWLEPGPGRR
ncbi:alpha/beta fold hydrolase [Pseudonocardia sp. GCM10023141]